MKLPPQSNCAEKAEKYDFRFRELILSELVGLQVSGLVASRQSIVFEMCAFDAESRLYRKPRQSSHPRTVADTTPRLQADIECGTCEPMTTSSQLSRCR